MGLINLCYDGRPLRRPRGLAFITVTNKEQIILSSDIQFYPNKQNEKKVEMQK
jgi:hypothetical protein